MDSLNAFVVVKYGRLCYDNYKKNKNYKKRGKLWISQINYMFMWMLQLCRIRRRGILWVFQKAEHFMEVLTKQYRQIILFVENVWEEETLKQLPAYGYICRTVYGPDLQSVLEKDRARRSPDKTKHILFITRSAQTLHGISVLCLEKMGLEQILLEKLQNEKKRRTVIAGICMGCVVYFAVYFIMLDKLPLWMRDGGIAFLLCLLPAELLILTLLYGLCKRVIPFDTIFEFFDMFG